MKTILISALAIVLIGSVIAQDGQPVNVSISAPLVGYTNLYYYSGTDLQYACRAKSQQPAATFGVSASTPYVLTSIVVATNVGTATTVSAHGLAVNDRVVVSGGTVDPDLNTSYKIITVGSTTTFTVTTASVSDGTYNNAALQFTTTAPRDTMPIWSVQKFTVAATLITASQWAIGASGASQICANRASLSFQ